MSVDAKKTLYYATLPVVVVVGIALALASIRARRTADASMQQALQVDRRAVDDSLAARTERLARASALATDVPQYRQRLLNQRDRAEALDQADSVRKLVDAAWVLVTDSDGVLIAWTDYREQYGRDLSIAPLVASALSGEQRSGAWLDDVRGEMFIAVGTPLRDHPTTSPRGALVATYRIDDSLAGALRQSTNSEIVFFSLDTLDQPVVVGSTLAQDVEPLLRGSVHVEVLAADSGAGTPLAASLGDRHLVGVAGAIRSPGGDVRGGFVVLRSR